MKSALFQILIFACFLRSTTRSRFEREIDACPGAASLLRTDLMLDGLSCYLPQVRSRGTLGFLADAAHLHVSPAALETIVQEEMEQLRSRIDRCAAERQEQREMAQKVIDELTLDDE